MGVPLTKNPQLKAQIKAQIKATIRLAVFSAVLAACSTVSKESTNEAERPLVGTVPTEEIHSEEGQASSSFEPNEEEQKRIEHRKFPLVLVLGPGMARGLAYAGVLKELSRSSVDVGAIVGIEMGALIGALYCSSASVNEFEWKLLKLKKSIFQKSDFGLTFFTSENKTRAKNILHFLEEAIGEKTFEELRLPLKVGVYEEESTHVSFIQSGKVIDAVMKAMTDYEYINPGNDLKLSIRSASEYRPFPVEEARELAIGPIVAVTVIKDMPTAKEQPYAIMLRSAQLKSSEELQQADYVLAPKKIEQIDYFEFAKKTDLLYLGEVAVKSHLTDIRYLIGDGDQQSGGGER